MPRPQKKHVLCIDVTDPEVDARSHEVTYVYLKRERLKRKFRNALSRLMREASGWA